jgi:hypothetical protein
MPFRCKGGNQDRGYGRICWNGTSGKPGWPSEDSISGPHGPQPVETYRGEDYPRRRVSVEESSVPRPGMGVPTQDISALSYRDVRRVAEDAALSRLRPIQDGENQWDICKSSSGTESGVPAPA